jgi:hypothetical protein
MTDDPLPPPAYQPYIWVYHGAMAEDVYEKQCAHFNPEADLELLASPRCHFVTLSYSISHVETVARNMWDEVQGDYEETYGCSLPFTVLYTTWSTRQVERPAGYERPMEVLEIVETDYYLARSVDPLMRVVVQKRPLRQ